MPTPREVMLNALLEAYLWRVAPGAALALLALALLPRALDGARLAVHLVLFVVLRDVMTPLNLWFLRDGPRITIRFDAAAGLLAVLAVLTGGLVLALLLLEPRLRRLLVWRRGAWPACLGGGLLGVVVILTPTLIAVHLWQGLATPVVPRAARLVELLGFALVGNLYEELLFRGYLQGLLMRHLSAGRAALLSGVLFALGHAPLALATTDVGAPLLAFCLLEGCVCGWVRMRWGLAAAALGHGLTIGLLASGMVGL